MPRQIRVSRDPPDKERPPVSEDRETVRDQDAVDPNARENRLLAAILRGTFTQEDKSIITWPIWAIALWGIFQIAGAALSVAAGALPDSYTSKLGLGIAAGVAVVIAAGLIGIFERVYSVSTEVTGDNDERIRAAVALIRQNDAQKDEEIERLRREVKRLRGRSLASTDVAPEVSNIFGPDGEINLTEDDLTEYRRLLAQERQKSKGRKKKENKEKEEIPDSTPSHPTLVIEGADGTRTQVIPNNTNQRTENHDAVDDMDHESRKERITGVEESRSEHNLHDSTAGK
jgi:hypothetical protein